MRFILAVLFIALFSVPGVAKAQKPKDACLEPRVSTRLPFQARQKTDTVKEAAEIQVPACTEYIKSFKKTKKPRARTAVKKLTALLYRARAHTVLGNKADARADIGEMRALADWAGLPHKLSDKYGVGVVLKAMEAMNGESPIEEFDRLVADYPYFEPIHQIALSYALDAKDYTAAIRYVTLLDMLNENAVMSLLKGYLLEITGQAQKALIHYQQSYPSIDTAIREAHLHLYAGDIEASRAAYEKARNIGDAPKAGTASWTLARAVDDRGTTMTMMGKKRLRVLKTLYELDTRGADAVYRDLLKMGSTFGHFELIGALQYVGEKLAHRPDKIYELDAKPKLAQNLNASRLRNTSLNSLPSLIPTSKGLRKVHPSYSSSIPFLSSKGFDSETLADGAVEVTFDGSLKADRATIFELTLLRAARLALKEDKAFFRIRDLNHYSKVLTYNYAVTGSTVGFKTKMVVEFSDTMESAEKDFDAATVSAALLPKYTNKK